MRIWSRLQWKSWYETLDNFLQEDLGFHRSRVEGCLYIHQKDSNWLKMINYVDDALYYANKGENNIMIDQDQYVKNIVS